MPVPSTINDLSTTADDNYPKGTENPFPLNDDFLRKVQSFIAELRDGKLAASAVSAYMLTVLNDPDAATARATLGIKTWDTGEWVLSAKTTAPTGTVVPNGGTIGNASSGATNRANADTSALFSLLWSVTSNTDFPIQDSLGAASTRGASAAADFAANKRFPLPNIQDGDALVAAVSSAVLSRTVGAVLGHGHTATVNDPGHSHSTQSYRTSGGAVFFGGVGGNMGDGSGTNSATTGISVTVENSTGTKNLAAGLMTRVYLAL